jgi:uncharacterized Fe-S cluster-containing radical SAM superfamily protein
MDFSFPFDPIERSAQAESLVMKGESRLYHKFRAAPYYGGIATADALGCSFLCAYCWNYVRNLNPSRFGQFYPPEEIASILLSIARKRFFHQFRITGSEPVLGEASFHHLLKVLEIIFSKNPDAVFILETNGLALGYRKDLIPHLKFKNLQVRIAIKGTDEASFEKITGAKKEYFCYPFLALQELENQGINAWPAVMEELFTKEEIRKLRKLLKEFNIQAPLEEETLEPYPFVLQNLKRRNVKVIAPARRDSRER